MSNSAANRTAIEVDDNPADIDSAFDDSDGSSFQTSISSSIKNYKYENGRRYHAYSEGAYPVPNDEQEQERLDLAHHIYQLILGGKLHLAPIGDKPQRVLDLGTGTGNWAIDFADQYPSAQVIGTDLSPIQPSWVPPNCTFEIDNWENDWLFARPFDYIHGREMMGFVTDYDRLFSQAFKNLNSGGYLEMQTADPQFFSDDGTLQRAPNVIKWQENLHKAGEKFGKSMTAVGTWEEKIKKAGFVDVKHEIFKVPVRRWPKDPKLKEIGKFQEVQLKEAIPAYTPGLFTRFLGWSKEEVDVLCELVAKELKDRDLHLYQEVHVIYGRKP